VTLVLGPDLRCVQRRQGTLIGKGGSPPGRITRITMKTIKALARFAFDLLTAPF